MLNQLGMMLGEIPTKSNLNKLEFHFLPLSKGNTEAGSPVLVEWVLEAVRGPESFLSLLRGPCWLLCLSAHPQSWRGKVQRHLVLEPVPFLGAFLEVSLNSLP